jgi:uncharacterized membrane protein YphA (DoxX/SURF4 family)
VTIGAVAGAVVGLTLLVAGVSKLVDRGWKAREIKLGSPAWALPFVAPIEVVLGALVAVRLQRLLLGLAAMVLLMAFTVFALVKWDERSGEPCNCFGVLSKRPTSARTIVRNIALIVLALVAAFVD